MPSPSLAALTGFDHKMVVGVGDLTVCNDPNAILMTYSLGSCLGVTIYDPVTQVGGLLHAMLPDSTIDPAKATRQPGMFVDTGLPALFRAAYGLRAEKYRVQICVAGGAQLLDPSGFFNIGKRNCESLSALLARHGLMVQAQQVGGMVSRTMTLHVRTGAVRLKVSNCTEEATLFAG